MTSLAIRITKCNRDTIGPRIDPTHGIIDWNRGNARVTFSNTPPGLGVFENAIEF